MSAFNFQQLEKGDVQPECSFKNDTTNESEMSMLSDEFRDISISSKDA